MTTTLLTLRRSFVLTGVAALLLFGALVPAAVAQNDEPTFDDEKRAILEENRRIWEKLTPQQRNEMIEKFRALNERWKGLTPAQRDREREEARRHIRKLGSDARYQLALPEGRDELRRRRDRMRRISSAILSNVTPEVSRGVSVLPEPEREYVRRYLWVIYLESRARMLLERQSDSATKAYKRMRPNAQREKLREWAGAWRDEILAKLPEAEIERLATLKLDARAHAKKTIVTSAMAKTQFDVTSRLANEHLPHLLELAPEIRAARIDSAFFRMGAEQFRDQFKQRFFVNADDRFRIDDLPIEVQDYAIAQSIYKAVEGDLRSLGKTEAQIRDVTQHQTWQEMADAYFKATWDGGVGPGPRPHGGRPRNGGKPGGPGGRRGGK